VGLFHEAASPVMIVENKNQNDNNDWSMLHRTASDKWLQQSDRQIPAVWQVVVSQQRHFPVTISCHRI